MTDAATEQRDWQEEREARYMHTALLTDTSLTAQLRDTYAPPEIPPCRVCGGQLGIAAVGGGNPTIYRCSEANLPDGRTDWDHYGRSEYRDLRQGGDSRVLELLRRYADAMRVIQENKLEVHGLPFAVHAAFEGYQAAAKDQSASTHARTRLLTLVEQYGGEAASELLVSELNELGVELAKDVHDVGRVTRLTCEALTSLRVETRRTETP